MNNKLSHKELPIFQMSMILSYIWSKHLCRRVFETLCLSAYLSVTTFLDQTLFGMTPYKTFLDQTLFGRMTPFPKWTIQPHSCTTGINQTSIMTVSRLNSYKHPLHLGLHVRPVNLHQNSLVQGSAIFPLQCNVEEKKISFRVKRYNLLWRKRLAPLFLFGAPYVQLPTEIGDSLGTN